MGKGQLLFKGEKPKKKSKKSKHHSSSSRSSIRHDNHQGEENDEKGVVGVPKGIDHSIVPAVASRPLLSTPSMATATAPPIMKQGTGKITTSGTVVTGYETRFEKELQAGDAILCTVGLGKDGREELRVVTMRLSNISLNLSSAFSTNVKTPTSFQYIRKPRDVHKERAEAHKRTAETLREQKTHAFDLYANNDSLVYREKTETGSYRIKREPLSVEAGRTPAAATARTRGDLLEMRAKKTSDKFC
jgi:hypothetical protein